MIMALFERFVFVGAFNISITYAVFIVFGLALGPWKGAIIGILCDTLNQVIFGISTWMPEYALIPVLIAFLSGFFINSLTKSSDKKTWIIGFIFLAIITIIFIVILAREYNSLPLSETSIKRKKKYSLQAVIGISTFGISLTWILSIIFLTLYIKTKSIKTKYSSYLLFNIFITVFAIIVITRWLWGPFAYINYHNRFRSGTWKYNEYYFFFMVPIIFKSLIEIPIYTFLIFSIYPIIRIIKNKINYTSKKISVY
ncbi:ECF transporter S component [Mycoplasmopsis arginini]|uniref:ECF transporter S component n=2 Tax=Mycoplasmopsis arginini TaxID=2094 RepID=A0AA43TZP8_MYCAR|nr:Hypothetical protein, predicted transmembrane protein [Mycoplasmopsis arginini 7264]MDI3348474.1 ECF transporter S component [Mycoplasmopsis arginini]MDI3348802.1 ECF transporter S component [Mycoplasmopsis arginini]MDI3349311.1 ECF transporter S component [Mycoplasmopsis arginini]MDI3351594.1 ECF transporter S component [Mycoplasmopsis arginini]